MRQQYNPLIFFTVALVAAGIVVALIFYPFFNVFLFSVAIGIIFQPVHRYITKRMPGYPGIAALLSTLVVLLILLGVLGALTTRLVQEAGALYVYVQDHGIDLGSATGYLGRLLGSYAPDISLDLGQYAKAGLVWLATHAGSTFSGAAQFLLSFLLSFIVLYYWFRDGGELRKYLLWLSPLPDKHDRQIFETLAGTVRSIIRGSIVTALIQGTLTGLGFAFFGVPNPVLWGVVASVSALIPAIGTSLVIVPAIIYLFLRGQTAYGIGLTIWGALAVGMIDNFLGPKLLGRGTKIHPLFVLVSVLGGLKLFGPIGFIAGPLFMSLFLALLDIYGQLEEDFK